MACAIPFESARPPRQLQQQQQQEKVCMRTRVGVSGASRVVGGGLSGFPFAEERRASRIGSAFGTPAAVTWSTRMRGRRPSPDRCLRGAASSLARWRSQAALQVDSSWTNPPHAPFNLRLRVRAAGGQVDRRRTTSQQAPLSYALAREFVEVERHATCSAGLGFTPRPACPSHWWNSTGCFREGVVAHRLEPCTLCLQLCPRSARGGSRSKRGSVRST